MNKWVCRVLFVATMGLAVQPAAARSDEPSPAEVANAQRLYEEGRRLMERKKYSEACPKLEQVAQILSKQPVPHDTLGECYKALHRFGSAWEQFSFGQSMAIVKGEPKRAAALGKKAKELENKVAKIKIVVSPQMAALEGLSISRNGTEQDKALWNTSTPADTGDHVIKVFAPGREEWSKTVTVLADGADLTVTVPELKAKEAPPPPPPPTAIVSRRTWQRPLGWTALGIGGAALATTGALSAMAVSKKNASNENGHCSEALGCDSVGKPLRDQAVGLANVATATMIFGGVLAAGGVVVMLAVPKSDEDRADKRKRANVEWNLEVSPMGVGVRGVW